MNTEKTNKSYFFLVLLFLILSGVGCLAGDGNFEKVWENLPWLKTVSGIALGIILIMWFATPKETGLEVLAGLIFLGTLILA